MLSGFQNEFPALQRRLDTIISGVRTPLHSDIQRVLTALPELQQWHCYAGFLSWLSNDDATILNDELYSQLVQEIDRLGKEYPRICQESDSTQLTARQLDLNKRISQCMTNLHPPNANDDLEEESVQPKMTPRFFRRVEFMDTPPSGITAGDRHLDNVINNLPNYNFIIDAVGILLNETAERVSLGTAAGEPDEANDRILSAMEKLALYERQFIAGLAKVSAALIYGLVQAYGNVCNANPQMANQHIDLVVNDDERIATIQKFRNAVFHVADPRYDPYQLDHLASYVLPEAAQNLFIGFSMFLGSIAAYARARESTHSPE